MPPNFQMPQMAGISPVQESNFNLLSILIDIAFGFVAGLMIFFGWQAVIAYGTKLATEVIKTTGYSGQMATLGIATSAAPFVVLAPIGGMVVKELSSVRSVKGFAIFVAAVAAGLAIAFFTKDYFASLILTH